MANLSKKFEQWKAGGAVRIFIYFNFFQQNACRKDFKFYEKVEKAKNG